MAIDVAEALPSKSTIKLFLDLHEPIEVNDRWLARKLELDNEQLLGCHVVLSG
jgi:hypothetical protein